jgi:hypothetical protein
MKMNEELEFETVTIKIRISDLMRIDRLIDEKIMLNTSGTPSEDDLELMKMYHRVMPDFLKIDF